MLKKFITALSFAVLSFTAIVPTAVALTTLTTPTITAPTANQILTNYPRTAYLEWTAVNNAKTYEIEIACDVCTSTQTKWLNPTTYTSTTNYYTTPALAGDNEFRFRVRALNPSYTTGSWSDYRYFRYDTSSYAATPETPTIISPTNNAVLTNYPRTAYLAWYSVTNAAKYEIEIYTDYINGTWSKPVNYDTTYTYYTTPALAGDYTYSFRVRAVNSSGTAGSWSDYRYFSYDTSGAAATPGTPIITSPTQNTVLTNYPRTAYLAWDSASNAAKYEIRLSTYINGAWSAFVNYDTTYTYYTTPALAGDYNYYFQVRAVNSNGTAGSWSDYRYFSYNTSGYSATPGTPTIMWPLNNTVLTNYPRKAYLEWSQVTNAAKYEIQMSINTNSGWLYQTTYYVTNTYYTTPALSGDDGFRFRVRALNSSDNAGSWSDYRYFEYDTSGYSETPDTPVIMWPLKNTVLTNYPRKAYLEWSEVSNAAKYEIQLACENCSSNNSKWSNPTTYSTTNSYYTTPALSGDYKFRFKVRALTSSNIAGSWSEYRYFSYDTSDDNNNTAPPAGYEDDVITNFDEYDNPFSDTDLSTLEGIAAAELYRRGVIGGYPDGEFKGYRTVNRAEIAKFLLLAKYGEIDSVKNNGKFSDVKEGEWYVKYVVTSYNKGIINGYADGTFRPNKPVKISEFLKMIALTFNLKLNLPYNFKDVDSDDWFEKYVGIVEKYDLLPKKDKYLNPNNEMTRNEVAVAIYQYLKNK